MDSSEGVKGEMVRVERKQWSPSRGPGMSDGARSGMGMQVVTDTLSEAMSGLTPLPTLNSIVRRTSERGSTDGTSVSSSAQASTATRTRSRSSCNRGG